MQAKMYNLAGDEIETVELDESIFGVTPNIAVIQQAVLRQQANARQGTHETLTRGQVRGGGRKPWRQKGTGRARQGSTRSPQWAHGGVVFGPHVRSYEQDMPRKMRRMAVRGVLSSKLADGRLVIIDGFDEIDPRTKVMRDTLGKLNVGEESVLIMTAESQESLTRAAGNLPRVKLMPASYLSIVDMLKHEFLIMPRAALDIVQGILSNSGGRRKLSLRRGENGAAAPAETTPVAEATPAAAKKSKKSQADETVEESIAFAPTASVAETAEATTTEVVMDNTLDTDESEVMLGEDVEPSVAKAQAKPKAVTKSKAKAAPKKKPSAPLKASPAKAKKGDDK